MKISFERQAARELQEAIFLHARFRKHAQTKAQPIPPGLVDNYRSKAEDPARTCAKCGASMPRANGMAGLSCEMRKGLASKQGTCDYWRAGKLPTIKERGD